MSIEDKLAILECLAAYSHTLDNGDDEGWVQLFTEDAVWESFAKGASEPSLRYEGHEGIRKFAAQMRSRASGRQARHNKVNTLFVELTPELARIRSNGVITVQVDGEEPRIALTGVYAETLRKTPQGWRLAHVVLHTDR
jgi:ketosteroid isomerase-like protein